MNDQDHEFDARLAQLFARGHTHVPAEPFTANALRAVAAERKRALLTTRLLQAAGVIALIALSPRLLGASAWVAMHLGALSAWASVWLASPFVLAGVALCALAALATKWARIW